MNKTIERHITRWLRHTGRRIHGERREKAQILLSLEEHIHEALYERCGDREPTMDDLRAVLSALDPPKAYRGGFETDPSRAGAENLADLALLVFAGTLGAMILILLVSITGWIDSGLSLIAGLAGFLLAGIMGLTAWPSLKGRAIGIASMVLFLGLLILLPVRVEGRMDQGAIELIETGTE